VAAVPAPKPQIVPPLAPQPAAVAPAASAAREAARVHSSPLVRRMAKEHGIDLTTVPVRVGGRVSKQDIEAAISGSAAPAGISAPAAAAPGAQRVAPPPVAPAPLAGGGGPAAHGTQYVPALQLGVPRERVYFGDYEVEPLSNMRLKIAEHMVASKHVFAARLFVDEIDMTKIASLRAKSKDELRKKLRHETDVHAIFREGCGSGICGRIGRLTPRWTAQTSCGTRKINIGIAVALDWGFDRARGKERRRKEYSRHSADDERSGGARAFEKAEAGRGAGRNVFDHESGVFGGCLDCR